MDKYLNYNAFSNQLFISNLFFRLQFTFLMLVIPITSQAEENKLKKNEYLGAGSCASSNCHGSSKQNTNFNILGNEYIVWKKKDSHSKAWKTLNQQDSKIIGLNLGISDPTTDTQCLKCHSTTTSPLETDKLSHDSYDTEGVTCEACHGSSANWIKSHTVKGITHEENLKKGMNDLVSPLERSKICLNCHLGESKNEVTHKLISAGHPRLTFELDTFSQIAPPHWKVDEDYIARKGEIKTVDYWIMGQLTRSIKFLNNFQASLKSNRQPDFAFSYCYSCHHDLSSDQWKDRNYHGKSGLLKLNLSSVLLTKVALKGLNKNLYNELDAQVSKLEEFSYTEIKQEDIQKLVSTLQLKVQPYLTDNKFDQKKMAVLEKDIIIFGKDQHYPNYEIAEQLIMALSSIADSSGENAAIKYKNFFDLLSNEEKFDEALFAENFRQL